MPTTQVERDSTTSRANTCRNLLDLPIEIRYLIYKKVLRGLILSNASCPKHPQERLPRFPRYERCRANCRVGLCFVEVSNDEHYTHRPRPFDCLRLINRQIYGESQDLCRIPTTLEVISCSSLRAFTRHHPIFKPKKLRRACALTVEKISVTAIKWDYEGLTHLAPVLSYLPRLRILEVRLPWYGICDPPSADDKQEMEGIHTEWSLSMYGWEKFSEFGPSPSQRYGSKYETVVQFERDIDIRDRG
jgi:hypothetical protein